MSDDLAIVKRMIAGWEALDPSAVGACFLPDGLWDNIPYGPIRGREAIVAAASKFVAGMVACRFELRHFHAASPGIVMSERVDVFVRRDGSELRFPVMGVFELEHGLIREWRDYFDSAIMAPADSANADAGAD